MMQQMLVGLGAKSLGPEDVLSIDTWAGNATARSISNSIDLSGEGGLVLIKNLTDSAKSVLFDTARGAEKYLETGSNANETTDSSTLTAFNSDGFSLGTDSKVNASSKNYAGLTIRQLEAFFNMVTYTGNQTYRNISHSLTVTPEMIWVKLKTVGTGHWAIYHKDAGSTKSAVFNNTNAFASDSDCWANTDPTSSVFRIGNDDKVNNDGRTYVAYLFATLAGFCKVDSYTGTGSSNNIDCSDVFTGTPRFVLIKNRDRVTGTDFRLYYDIASGNDSYFTTDANTALPVTNTDEIDPLSSGGFTVSGTDDDLNRSGDTYVYIAIK